MIDDLLDLQLLAVSGRLLGQVVINNQGVLFIVAEPLADIGAVEPVHPAADDPPQGRARHVVNIGFEHEADGVAVG